MAYQSDTIATVINRLNTQYFLPAIQREFVWQPEQIIQLFDSIMRGYPISSFLFWELKPENRDKWEIYKFIENFQQYGTHNETANTDGVHQLMLVLDGQQRLTSLLIGLRGTYKTKKKYMHWGNPNAWVKQRLYIDLLQDPKLGDGDGDIGNRYGFAFAETPPPSDGKHFWFKVGRILDFESEDAFGDFVYSERDKLPDDVTKGMITVFEKNLRRLYQAVWKDTIVSYYTEHDQDYDRVLDIFVRANEGGTKLSKSDLLLSMVTLKWSGINAREEIYRCVDRVNNELTRKNDLDKDFVMKTCLVLSDLGVTYKVENFNKQNLMLIQQNWDGIKSAIERGVDLVNTFGIDRDTLTSANALIPIIYYLYKTPTTHLQGSTQFDKDNATAIRRWLIVSLLNNVFGRASDGVLTETRRVLREQLAQLVKLQQIVATKYLGLPVWINLCNEPHELADWASCSVAMQSAASAIRAIDPNALITCPFEGYSKRSTANAAKAPITATHIDLYDYHAYNTPDELRTNLLPALAAGMPILVGEYGGGDAAYLH